MISAMAAADVFSPPVDVPPDGKKKIRSATDRICANLVFAYHFAAGAGTGAGAGAGAGAGFSVAAAASREAFACFRMTGIAESMSLNQLVGSEKSDTAVRAMPSSVPKSTIARLNGFTVMPRLSSGNMLMMDAKL